MGCRGNKEFDAADGVVRWVLVAIGILVAACLHGHFTFAATCAIALAIGVLCAFAVWVLYQVLFWAGVPTGKPDIISPDSRYYRAAAMRQLRVYVLAFAVTLIGTTLWHLLRL